MNTTDSILDKLREVQDWHTRGNPKLPYTAQVAEQAIAEIERLRASAFHWIPVSERLPTKKDEGELRYVFSAKPGEAGISCGANLEMLNQTHWAPIPPLPEPPAKTQEQKDEEAWRSYAVREQLNSHGPKEFFLAGLKAAREQP